MKTLVLVDSCFCILTGKKLGNPFRLFSWYEDRYEFATCGMVMVEVLRGYKEPKVVEAWRREFARLTYLPTERSTWGIIQKLVWDFERAGRRLDMPDVIIAASALESGAVVLTSTSGFPKSLDCGCFSALPS